MSMKGLEPLQISPHAPQACASTIPPHRHILYSVFNFCLDSGGDERSVHPPSFSILNRKSGVLATSTHIVFSFQFNLNKKIFQKQVFYSFFKVADTNATIVQNTNCI